MKKAVKIWMITAAGLIALGLLLSVIAFAAVGGDIKKLSTVNFEENTYTFKDTFHNIDISSDCADIELIKTDEKECRVVCYEEENQKHTVEIAGHEEEHQLTTSDNNSLGTIKGTVYDELHIEMKDTRSLLDHLNLSFDKPTVTVYLPKTEFRDITIKTSTGNIIVPDDFSFDNITLSADTGNISCGASAKRELNLNTSTGNIRAEDASFGKADLSASTGNIRMDSVTVKDSLKVRATTGNIELKDVTCDDLTAKANTGNIELTHVVAKGDFDIEANTGNIKFDDCDADEIDARTDTGNIKGTLLSDKIFMPKSDTGKIDVPETTSGGKCKLTTDTGNIEIKID